MELRIDRNELTVDWADRFRKLSEKKEYAAFVYSMEVEGEKKYYIGRTYSGFGRNGPIQPNVIIPFIYFYVIESIFEWLKNRAKIECFIHTHPKPKEGFTNRHFSPVDLKLLELRRMKSVCVVPYENNEINTINK